MATQSNRSYVSGLDLIKSLPEALELYQKALLTIERYRLFFGEIPEHYGEVDVMAAFKTYREKESFHQNFGRYMEALKAKLEGNDLRLDDPEATTTATNTSPQPHHHKEG